MGMEQSPRAGGGGGGTVRVLSLSLAGSWISRDAGIVHAASVGWGWVEVGEVGVGVFGPRPLFFVGF